MNITIDIAGEDIVKQVHLDCSPLEYLILNKALKKAQIDEDWFKSDRNTIEKMLAVEPICTKIGHWTHDGANVRCSNCGKGYKEAFGRTSASTYNYCPNCGAKMGVEDEMTKDEIIADKRYHTCGRCRWGDLNDDFYPCNKCIHSADKREDLWQYAEDDEVEHGNDDTGNS